ncbi:MAG: hypothetical protein QOG35_2844 [Solirubrobacteraceae bacterium]|jgi:hypothetical protein|nr:hypothetical protein [Solirubrobacteraceae bacterium]
MRRRAAILVALAAMAAAAAGCGGVAPDLFVITRTGDVPGARLTLRVTDDGRASCNGRPLVDITSAQLITARETQRDLIAPAKARMRLPAGPQSVMSYRVRSDDGAVTWSDNSRGQPLVLFRLAKLARDVARGACRLAR